MKINGKKVELRERKLIKKEIDIKLFEAIKSKSINSIDLDEEIDIAKGDILILYGKGGVSCEPMYVKEVDKERIYFL